MNIAIIGSGNVGGALAKASFRGGHMVTLSAKDPAHVEANAKETGARTVSRGKLTGPTPDPQPS